MSPGRNKEPVEGQGESDAILCATRFLNMVYSPPAQP